MFVSRKSRRTGQVIVAAAAAVVAGGLSQQVNAAAINVGMANVATTATTGNLANGGINPITYTPATVTIGYAPSVNYDAADTTDAGTIWNSIQAVSTAPTIPSVGTTNVLYEQNLPLVDSTGAATAVTLNVSAVESNAKVDFIHTTSNISGTNPTGAGTDLLAANPSNSTYLDNTSTLQQGDGYLSGIAHHELMGAVWIANGAGEGFSYTFSGLTPSTPYKLYVYGAGTTAGQGGTFTLAAGNGGGSATVNSVSTAVNRSVFDSGGINPGPEQGISWNVITGTSDATGQFTFTELAVNGIKPAINGFQLDVVPEPASVGVLALGALGLLGKRRARTQ